MGDGLRPLKPPPPAPQLRLCGVLKFENVLLIIIKTRMQQLAYPDANAHWFWFMSLIRPRALFPLGVHGRWFICARIRTCCVHVIRVVQTNCIKYTIDDNTAQDVNLGSRNTSGFWPRPRVLPGSSVSEIPRAKRFVVSRGGGKIIATDGTHIVSRTMSVRKKLLFFVTFSQRNYLRVSRPLRVNTCLNYKILYNWKMCHNLYVFPSSSVSIRHKTSVK